MNPFTHWTAADVAAFNRRNKKSMAAHSEGDQELRREGVKRERDLHYLILDECRKRGWIALHGSMAERTHRTEGEPDFCCLAPNGLVLFVECKSKQGKLSPEQLAMQRWMAKLGHLMHVVRSFEEFVSLATLCEERGLESSRSFGMLEVEKEGAFSNANAIAAISDTSHGQSCTAASVLHVESQVADPEQSMDCQRKAQPTTDGKL